MATSWEHGSKILVPIQGGKYLHQLSDYQVFKNGYAPGVS
jgi:hypothetical protein